MCQYFFFADAFKSDIWTEFFASIPVHLLPLASVVRQCLLTLEVSRDGEDGLRSNIFATCQSTLPSSRFTCIVVLRYPTVLLRYSMSCLALIGRRIWPPYRRYLITLWFTLRLVRLREFWGGRETKKILSTSFPGFSGRRVLEVETLSPRIC